MSWRVARSLDVLLEEINAAAPRRNKAADGSIGDAAHAARTSDYNPWVTLGGQGIVRARDFTNDPANGLDCERLAQALAALIAVGGHPACRSGAYVIWNGRIYSFDRRHEGWRHYAGSNPHSHHLHLSVATDPMGFDSTAPWFVMAQEDDMFTDDDRRLLREIADDVERTRKGSFKRDRELIRLARESAEDDEALIQKANRILGKA